MGDNDESENDPVESDFETAESDSEEEVGEEKTSKGAGSLESRAKSKEEKVGGVEGGGEGEEGEVADGGGGGEGGGREGKDEGRVREVEKGAGGGEEEQGREKEGGKEGKGEREVKETRQSLRNKDTTESNQVTSVKEDEPKSSEVEKMTDAGAQHNNVQEAKEDEVKNVETRNRERTESSQEGAEGGGGERGGGGGEAAGGGGGEAAGGGGEEGGGWGWGGWGWKKSLWSSVSTVTESARQKVTAAITTVEDALGLPSPHELATEREDEEREGEKEGEKRDGYEEEKKGEGSKGEGSSDQTERTVEHDVNSQQTSPGSVPVGQQVELDSDQTQEESPTTIGAFSGFFTGIATAVEQKSFQLVSEGLGALENIGKKTMEVLTEGDPGLQKKRKLLKRDAPSLSVLLREAKAEAEAKQNETRGSGEVQAALSYSRLFDEYQGVVHLEALELLSKEYGAKVRGCLPSLSGEDLERVEQQMERVARALTIKENEGLDVMDDDSGKLGEVVELFSDITVPLKVDKLVKVSEFWREKLDGMSASLAACEPEGGTSGGTRGTGGNLSGGTEGGSSGGTEGNSSGGTEEGSSGGTEEGGGQDKKEEVPEVREEEREGDEGKELKTEEEELETKKEERKLTSDEVYANGLRGLVELTSVSIELFRKMAEISLLPQVTKADTIEQAERFNRLTVLVSNELDALASVHAEILTETASKDDVNSTITSLYLESSNSVSYVQDALQLLKPVLQYTLLQEVAVHEPEANVHSRS